MAEGGEGGEGGSSDKKQQAPEESGKHKKLLRLLTVFAYLSTVSGTAFMLSLYYLFLWTPKVQLGGKALVQDPPPSTLALFYPEMAPQLAARVDPHGGVTKGGEGAVGGENQVPPPPLTMSLPPVELASEGRRREARSTLMEMSTTTQRATTTGQQERTTTLPHATTHRAKGKGGGGEVWTGGTPPLPAEVHA
ncbi:putative transmembrane protein INAFM2 isoform X2 [Hetaerina americana]|uniref:putative transmembrane protein INAFM2 isoform X2 n=1 Tax=Hetaerina americana TaxID=62018 RepID=UPI003A7F5CA3